MATWQQRCERVQDPARARFKQPFLRHKHLAHVQRLDGDTSVSLDARSDGRAVTPRHALLSDFNLTEPFGIVNAAAGIIGLFFKV